MARQYRWLRRVRWDPQAQEFLGDQWDLFHPEDPLDPRGRGILAARDIPAVRGIPEVRAGPLVRECNDSIRKRNRIGNYIGCTGNNENNN